LILLFNIWGFFFGEFLGIFFFFFFIFFGMCSRVYLVLLFVCSFLVIRVFFHAFVFVFCLIL
jgi:hypothetical protein